jgi:molecular chaperone HscB
MKRIIEYRKLFDVTPDADLNKLKTVYRKLVKEWHPDKFQEGDPLKAQAESKSKVIIDAYHFLVSINP